MPIRSPIPPLSVTAHGILTGLASLGDLTGQVIFRQRRAAGALPGTPDAARWIVAVSRGQRAGILLMLAAVGGVAVGILAAQLWVAVAAACALSLTPAIAAVVLSLSGGGTAHGPGKAEVTRPAP